MRRGLLAGILALGLGACAARQPAPPGTIAGPAGPETADDRAQLWWVPVRPYTGRDEAFLLETMIYRPAGAGPFPLVTINHGLPADKWNLQLVRPGFEIAAHWWVTHGYAVAVPLRRGVGRSQGALAEWAEACSADDFVHLAYVSAIDMRGTVAYLAKQPFVDPSRIVVVGQSAGGFGGLALAADPPPGVVAVLDFAGGVGGYGNGEICGGADNLIEAARQLGQRSKLPELWLFSENDRWFGAIAKPMYEAYRAGARAPVGFVALPPFGDDGHGTLYRADPAVWAAAVTDFLKTVPARAPAL
ncbi:MAG TPA: CocE/NonD family hydrolase [Aliidongia sp.]|uniref:alpha/beta hydrolase family protein n=1 Tax=Aliidongia sp. TaxID=1914230 RepID=UPI002DDCD580|nr:CocE/NonD family hydrolase [Aliidongia sp.]HEV2673206.1 CocE/NonD family hydrolase [Aliidongia sp.]